MENASKALLMAGGILISMLVITVAIILINTYSQLGVTYQDKMVEVEIQKFNSNFTKFEGREDITIHEIVSIVNFAKKYKEQTEIDIQVKLGNNELKDSDSVYLIKTYLSEDVDGSEEIKKFKCAELSYDDNGKVKEIRFSEN